MLKFIVYKLTFLERLKSQEKPYYYIGMKSNCYLRDDIIYDKKGKSYFGSCNSKQFKDALLKEIPKAEILYEGINSKDINEKEICYLKEFNVNVNDEYFNRFIYESASNFTWSDCSNFIHKESGVIKRLHNTNPCVLSGQYIHYSKHYFSTHEANFRGMKHTDEAKIKMSAGVKRQFRQRTKEQYKRDKNNSKKRMKGITYRPDGARGREGYMTFKHKYENYYVTVNKYTEPLKYKFYSTAPNWSTPYKLRKNGEVVACPKCGKTGYENNASFLKWHFDNCGKAKNRTKWNISTVSDELMIVYSKLGIIYSKYTEFINLHNGNRNRRNKGIFNREIIPLIFSEYGDLYTKFRHIFIVYIKKFDDGYNPNDDVEWTDKFLMKGTDNEN